MLLRRLVDIQYVRNDVAATRGTFRVRGDTIDVFPADDVGARNKLQRFFALPTPPDRKQILTLMEPWAPYAGMMYFHMLLDGLAERGDIHP